MRRGFLFIGLWVAVGMFGFGCAGEDAPPVNPSPDPDVVALDASELSHDVGSAGDVTWHGGVAQVFKTRCGDCHTEGGAAPFPLDEYESARAYAEAALASVHSGAMPPWPPSMNCRPIKHAREISEPEVALLQSWIDTGKAEGIPESGDVVPVIEPDGNDEPPGLRLSPTEPYVADVQKPDDYRCLILDHAFEKPTAIKATEVFPDQQSLVHHVLAYIVSPEDVAELEARDTAEEGAGYTCFGGPGVQGRLLAGWAPGIPRIEFPQGAGVFIEPGSRIVMQMHYNLASFGVDNLPPADLTEVGFWLYSSVNAVEQEVGFRALANKEIYLGVGDPEVIETMAFDNPGEALVFGVAPHMHLLGVSIQLEISRGDGEQECIVDIPDWRFDWQQFYLFEEEAQISVSPGDQFILTCKYDNSAANQPIVNGVQQETTEVVWGEGTFDEMCMAYLMTLSPVAPATNSGCPTAPDCLVSCDEGASTCVLSCLETDGTDCVSCALSSLAQCAGDLCQDVISEGQQCVNTCQNCDSETGDCDKSLVACLNGECADVYEAFYTCVEVPWLSGACDATLEANCGFPSVH